MKYLTDAQLCEIFQITRHKTIRLRKQGMPYIKVGGSYRYELDKVLQWFQEQEKK